jgi:Ca-activated chloride channel homolog
MRCTITKLFTFAIPVAFLLVSILPPGGSVSASNPANQEKEKRQEKKPPAKQDPQDKDEPVIKLGADLVMLDVAVIDTGTNNAVMTLSQNDFQVFEDKIPQEIKFFGKDQVPVSMVFTIDTSGSMRVKLDTVIKAAKNLVKDARPEDEMSVIEFKDQPELLQEFTTDKRDVEDTLDGLVARSQTAMLDAIYVAADYVRKEARKDGKNRRKALLVVTDGLDKENYYKFDEVVKQLQESDVQIYLIGFTQDLDGDSGLFKKSQKSKAETLLTKLATETGGRAFFPKELSEVHQIGQQISTDLRTQYSIGYYPTNANRDGTFRAVKVQINSTGNKRLVARTRSGYYATADKPATSTNSKP